MWDIPKIKGNKAPRRFGNIAQKCGLPDLSCTDYQQSREKCVGFLKSLPQISFDIHKISTNSKFHFNIADKAKESSTGSFNLKYIFELVELQRFLTASPHESCGSIPARESCAKSQ